MATKEWKSKHQRFDVWLTPTDAKHLQVILGHSSFEGFHDWMRAALHNWSSRVPESQGRVRIELDPERDEPALALAMEVMAREGQGLHEAWRMEHDPGRRADLRQRAALLLDGAAHMSTIIEKLVQRRHVMAEGLKKVRHRYIPEACRKAPHSSTSPSRRSQSK